MRYQLENEKLLVEIDSFGAQILSVKSKAEDREYMWNGDPTYWGRTSPVLFPFVGSLKKKAFLVDGVSYPMGQHGFARDMEHAFVEQGENFISFVCNSTKETLQRFPFPFVLKITYRLERNRIRVIWEVENPGAGKLPFSIGAHPAFFCPVKGEPDKTGYQLRFQKFAAKTENTPLRTVLEEEVKLLPVDVLHHHGNTTDTGLALTEDISLELVDGCVALTKDFFDRCTYMVEGNQANSVGIVDPEGREYVTVLFDTPLFAIWSPEGKNAPFLCIEPWYGRCDAVDFEGEIWDRPYGNVLKPGENFHAEYIMSFQ